MLLAAGMSGGVDSSVAAALVHKAIGDQLVCVFVDHGLLRKSEAEQVEEPDSSFDAGLCALGWMYVPSPLDAAREMESWSRRMAIQRSEARISWRVLSTRCGEICNVCRSMSGSR